MSLTTVTEQIWDQYRFQISDQMQGVPIQIRTHFRDQVLMKVTEQVCDRVRDPLLDQIRIDLREIHKKYPSK